MSVMTASQFWKSMAERFGNPWFEKNGKMPTKAWVDLLEQFERADVETAQLRLKDRPERDRAHPPSHAEFQHLLVAAKKSRNAATDEVKARARWRSVVIAECLKCAGLLNIIPYGATRLDQLPSEMVRMVSAKCDELLTDVCTRHRTGETANEITGAINAELWNFLKPWRRDGEHYIGHLSAKAPLEQPNN